MSNFDLVFAYDLKTAAYFRSRGLPHPPVKPGNRMPTTSDVRWALDSLPNAEYDRWPDESDRDLTVHDEEHDYWISLDGFDWTDDRDDPGDAFIVRGRGPLAFALVVKLCGRCGQLLLYPDTGEAPVVLDATMDPNEINRLHRAAEREDHWDRFFTRLYAVK